MGLLLIAVGLGAIGLGAVRIRGPLATVRRLDETEANLQRYEAWRGKRNSVSAEGPTGADEMRAQMRRQSLIWGALIVA
ncbi:MAG: hypothetical protein ACC726_08490, partial [Chloroflexota bacterium]